MRMEPCVYLVDGEGWDKYVDVYSKHNPTKTLLVGSKSHTKCWWVVSNQSKQKITGLGDNVYHVVKNEFAPFGSPHIMYRDVDVLSQARQRVVQAGAGLWYNRRGIDEYVSTTGQTSSSSSSCRHTSAVSADFIVTITSANFERFIVDEDSVKEVLRKASATRLRLHADATLEERKQRGVNSLRWNKGVTTRAHRVNDRVLMEHMGHPCSLRDSIFLSGEAATGLGTMYLWNNSTARSVSSMKNVAIDDNPSVGDKNALDYFPPRYTMVTETSKVSAYVFPRGEGVPEPTMGPLKAAHGVASVLAACETHSDAEMIPLFKEITDNIAGVSDTIGVIARHAQKTHYEETSQKRRSTHKHGNCAANLLSDIEDPSMFYMTGATMQCVAHQWKDTGFVSGVRTSLQKHTWIAIINTLDKITNQKNPIGIEDAQSRTLERVARNAANRLVAYVDDGCFSGTIDRASRIARITTDLFSCTQEMITYALAAGLHQDSPLLDWGSITKAVTLALDSVRKVALYREDNSYDSDKGTLFEEFTDAILSVIPQALRISHYPYASTPHGVHECPTTPLYQNTAITYAAHAALLSQVYRGVELGTVVVRHFRTVGKALTTKIEARLSSSAKKDSIQLVTTKEAKTLMDLSSIVYGRDAATFFSDPGMLLSTDIISGHALDSLSGNTLTTHLDTLASFIYKVTGLIGVRSYTTGSDQSPLHGGKEENAAVFYKNAHADSRSAYLHYVSDGDNLTHTTTWTSRVAHAMKNDSEIIARDILTGHSSKGPFEERPCMSRNVHLLLSSPSQLVSELDTRALQYAFKELAHLHHTQDGNSTVVPDKSSMSGTNIATVSDTAHKNERALYSIPVTSAAYRATYRKRMYDMAITVIGGARGFLALAKRCPSTIVPLTWACSTLSFTWGCEQEFYANKTIMPSRDRILPRAHSAQNVYQWPLAVSKTTRAHFETNETNDTEEKTFTRVRMKLDTPVPQVFNCMVHVDTWVYGLPQTSSREDIVKYATNMFVSDSSLPSATDIVVTETPVQKRLALTYNTIATHFVGSLCTKEAALYHECLKQLRTYKSAGSEESSTGSMGISLKRGDIPVVTVSHLLYSMTPPKEVFTDVPSNSVNGKYVKPNDALGREIVASVSDYVLSNTGHTLVSPKDSNGKKFATPKKVVVKNKQKDTIDLISPHLMIAQRTG